MVGRSDVFLFCPHFRALMTRSLYQGEEQKVSRGGVDDKGYLGDASELVALAKPDKLMATFGNFGRSWTDIMER